VTLVDHDISEPVACQGAGPAAPPFAAPRRPSPRRAALRRAVSCPWAFALAGPVTKRAPGLLRCVHVHCTSSRGAGARNIVTTLFAPPARPSSKGPETARGGAERGGGRGHAN